MTKYLAFLIVFFIFISCKKERSGTIEIEFSHTIDAREIKWNELVYKNLAGNEFQVNEVKYFISKITFHQPAGKSFSISQDDGIHYVESNFPNTMRWKLSEMPAGFYTYITFTFGLDVSDNKSNRFVNPPESNFSWPDILGGGYHYMQINGKYNDECGITQPMNIHTGIGQFYNDTHQIVGYKHNHFVVTIPVTFFLYENTTQRLQLNMEIQRWFDTPNIYNIDDFGSGIMQNQTAQELLKANGHNVFTLTVLN